jgi:DNA recombination protein RmuC
MVAALSALIGLVVGAAIAWTVASRRVGSSNSDHEVRTQLAVRDSELRSARGDVERLRKEHEDQVRNLGVEFESLSNRVLKKTVEGFNLTQEQLMRERETSLDRTLAPLTEALEEYKRNLADFDLKHVGALGEVKNSAEVLLREQQRAQEETKRLNQLLGRSDRRGKWGEIQLANVLDASGLREGIDYELQVTSLSEAGNAQRPDCVVNVSHGVRVAIDAKFPFDAFEKALSCDNEEERRALEVKHAKDLRAHVKTLHAKSYWEIVGPSPEFVVCFVPSDEAVSVALDSDSDLLRYGADERVLLAGPTNLLSLLWSVAMVVRRQEFVGNAEEILKQAEKIFSQIRNVAGPVVKMGKALNAQVEAYNAMVGSFESRLIVGAQRMKAMGAAGHAKEMPGLFPIEQSARPLNEAKWDVDAESFDEDAGEILDLNGYDDEDDELKIADE